MENLPQTLFALFTYLVFIGLIAYSSYHRQKNTSDFLMGNRSLNFWVTALSAHASDMSSWLFLAFPASVFLIGFQQAWAAVGLLFGMTLNWILVAKPLRVKTEKLECLSLCSFLELSFKDKSGFIRVCSSFFLLFFFTIYLASGLVGIGILFESMFQLDYQVGVLGAIILMLLYTLLGGFVTVAWTDFFQALFLLAAVLITPFLAFSYFDWDQIYQAFLVTNTQSKVSSSSLFAIFTSLGWGLGYFGQPHILSKFMGIKDPKELGKSTKVGVSWQFFALAGSVLVGIAGILHFPDLAASQSELLFVLLVKKLFSPFFAGLILCGVLAATLSTIDTMLLVSATCISEDFFSHYYPKAKENIKLLVARLSLTFMGALSFVIAYLKISSVYSLVFYAWAGLGATFGPLILACCYQKKLCAKRGILSLTLGGFVAMLWPYAQKNLLKTSLLGDLPTMIVAYSLCLAILFWPSKRLDQTMPTK